MASPLRVRECVFKFRCPMSWDLLRPTTDENVRHCPECRRNVFLTATEQELLANAALGRCVAVESEGAFFVGQPSFEYGRKG